jgi:hypothetical protein
MCGGARPSIGGLKQPNANQFPLQLSLLLMLLLLLAMSASFLLPLFDCHALITLANMI